MEIAELTKIYRAELASQIWAVSYEGQPRGMLARLFTNGHVLLVEHVTRLCGDERPLPWRWAKSVPNVVGLVYTLLYKHGKPVSHGALVEFTKDTSWRPSECDKCEGTGCTPHSCKACGHEHACICPQCQKGMVLPGNKPGRIDATDGSGRLAAFDRNYVGLLLEALPPAERYVYAADDFLFALAPHEGARFFAALSRSAAEPAADDPQLRALEARAS